MIIFINVPLLGTDKRVWNDLKNNAVGQQRVASPKDLHRAVMSHLRCTKNPLTGCFPISIMRQQNTQPNVYIILGRLIAGHLARDLYRLGYEDSSERKRPRTFAWEGEGRDPSLIPVCICAANYDGTLVDQVSH